MTPSPSYLNARHVCLVLVLAHQMRGDVVSRTISARDGIGAFAEIAKLPGIAGTAVATAVPTSPTTSLKLVDAAKQICADVPTNVGQDVWSRYSGGNWTPTTARSFGWACRVAGTVPNLLPYYPSVATAAACLTDSATLDDLRSAVLLLGGGTELPDNNTHGSRKGFRRAPQVVQQAPAADPAPSIMDDNDSVMAMADEALTNAVMAQVPNAPADPFAGAMQALQAAQRMAEEQVKLRQEVAGMQRLLETANQTMQGDQREVTSLRKLVSELQARPMVSAGGHQTPAPVEITEPTVPLDKVAQACCVTVDVVKGWVSSFLERVTKPVDVVRWPDWADPSKPACRASISWTTRTPMICTGPSGTGKTHPLTQWLRHHTGRALVISCNRDLTETKLVSQVLVRGGETMTQLNDIALAALTQTPVILDELDHLDLAIQSIAHGWIDHRRVTIRSANLDIPLSSHFPSMVATCNSLSDDSGKYNGEIGTALANRFMLAQYVDYPEAKIETEIVSMQAGVQPAHAKGLVDIANLLRTAEQKDGRITGPFTVRSTVAAARYFAAAKRAGADSKQALGDAVETVWVMRRPVAEQLATREIITQQTGNDFLSSVGGVA